MSAVVDFYQKNFLQRFDKDAAIPYFSPADFPGLFCEENSFHNAACIKIRYFIYRYENFDPGKLILFCPGIGPGYTAYLAEIETLCRAGYRVLTLDYTGCGASGGERLSSINTPTRDAMELLDRLHPQEEVIPVGHSLGGYTALNVTRLSPTIKRAVILSGFISIADEMMSFVKFRLLANRVKRFEQKLDPHHGSPDNRSYLSATTDNILWIHSTDDPMVNYKYNAGRLSKMKNPHLRLLTVEQKKHNPQYAPDALQVMNDWIGTYNRLIQENKLETVEARKAYFSDKPIRQMTAQDPAVWGEILQFIKA